MKEVKLLGALLCLCHTACVLGQTNSTITNTTISNTTSTTEEPVELGERRSHYHHSHQQHSGGDYQGHGTQTQGSYHQQGNYQGGGSSNNNNHQQGNYQGGGSHQQGNYQGGSHQQGNHQQGNHQQGNHQQGNHQQSGSQGSGGHYKPSNEQYKTSKLRVEYAWKKIDFTFPSSRDRQEAIRSGAYNYTQIIPLDVDVWEKGQSRKVFVTMPAEAGGVPASLTTVSDLSDASAPLLAPYPDWAWHRKGDCSHIVSVYRIAIDEVDRLWVLDRGDGAQCKPKLLVFDLHTDRLLDQYHLPSNVYKQGSNLITPIVDVRDGGRNTFVYIADVTEYAIIVYDHQRKASWRVVHPLAAADPTYGTYSIAGSSFTLNDGVFGMALSPLQCDGRHCEDRTLYFHALASIRENYVKTSVLRNQDNFRNGQNRVAEAFHTFENTRPSQSAAEAMSGDGVLFSGLLRELAITCWNTGTPFAGWNLEVVAQDSDTLQFTSGMKVRYGRLWVVSCRYQRFATNTMNWNEVNYRVQSGRVSDLIRGTKCDPKTNTIG